jgi:hypothetical protein
MKYKRVFEGIESKIKALRNLTVDRGATEHEAASAAAKADELEGKHKGAIDASRNAKLDAFERDQRPVAKTSKLRAGYYVLDHDARPLNGPHPEKTGALNAYHKHMTASAVVHFDGKDWRHYEGGDETITHKVKPRVSPFFRGQP